MPNHITNVLRIHADEKKVKEVLDFLKSDELKEDGSPIVIDFNKIIPMPEELNIPSGWGLKVEDDLAERQKSNIEKYGYADWYGWRLSNWGTKWNAYDTEQTSENEILFLTAWSGVPELMAVVSTKFPDVDFEYLFADEDISYNVGRFEINDGNIQNFSPENGTKEAYELCFELGVACEDDYEFKDGEYVWRDED